MLASAASLRDLDMFCTPYHSFFCFFGIFFIFMDILLA